MSASDGRWPPLKNTAWRVTFPCLDADGDLVPDISDLDSEVSKDGGAFADCTNEGVEIAALSGMYYLDLIDSEMNADTVAIIIKSSISKTTPIVVYPVSGGFNEAVTDHDKTQSDIADLSTKLASDVLLIEADIATIDAAVDSDSLLYIADHDKTQSDVLLISGKLDSDALLADADHDKTQSDIGDLSTKVASDHLLTQSDLSDIISELVVLDAAMDSDMVILVAEHDATQAKVESDSILFDADHDKTQSDIADLSTKQDSDMLLEAADHDKTQSDILLVDNAIDSDAVLEAADHDKTQSDIADLNNVSTAEVNAEVVDALNVDTYAEPGQGAPAATASLVAKLGYLYKNWRNKKSQDATTFELYNDDAATVDQKATVSDDGTDAIKGEIATGP